VRGAGCWLCVSCCSKKEEANKPLIGRQSACLRVPRKPGSPYLLGRFQNQQRRVTLMYVGSRHGVSMLGFRPNSLRDRVQSSLGRLAQFWNSAARAENGPNEVSACSTY
jgi:hypothetical protein